MAKRLAIFLFMIFPTILFSKIVVTVSILPQKYFVQKIAGDLAKVEVMVPPGSEPANYEPKPKQLSNLTKSKIYFTIGVPYERVWVPRFKDINKNMIFCDSSKGIKRYPMASSYTFVKDKKRSRAPKKRALDPHIWLSPLLVKKISQNIAKAFIKIDKKHKDVYERNLQSFLKEIEDLHRYGKDKLKGLKQREFIVFHPVWGYFAREFDLRQIPIQIEGKTPKISTLIKLINYAKKRGIKTIFVQPEFSKKSAQVIAKNINGKVVALDPLEENWQKSIKKAIDTFSKVLQK